MKNVLLILLASIAVAKARPEPPPPGAGHRRYLPPSHGPQTAVRSEEDGVTQAHFPLEALPIRDPSQERYGAHEQNDPFSYQSSEGYASPSRDYEAPDLEYGAPEPQVLSALPSQEYGAPPNSGARTTTAQHRGRVPASGARVPHSGAAVRAQAPIASGNGAHGHTAAVMVYDDRASTRGYFQAPSNGQEMMNHERHAKNGSPSNKYATPAGRHDAQIAFNRAPSSPHQDASSIHGAQSSRHQSPSNSYGPPTSRQQLPPNSYATPSSRQETPSNVYGASITRQHAPLNGHKSPSHGHRAPTNGYEAPSSHQHDPDTRYGAHFTRYQASTNDKHHEAQVTMFGGPSSRHQAGAYSNGMGAPHLKSQSGIYGAPFAQQEEEPSAEYRAHQGSHQAPSAKYGAPSHHQEAPVNRYAGPASYDAHPSSRYPGVPLPSGMFVPESDRRGDSANAEKESEEQPAKYQFDYKVRDEESGVDFAHQEEREGGEAKGEFRVLLPDGRTLIVAYTADEEGYHPEVTYEGEAEEPRGKSEELNGPY